MPAASHSRRVTVSQDQRSDAPQTDSTSKIARVALPKRILTSNQRPGELEDVAAAHDRSVTRSVPKLVCPFGQAQLSENGDAAFPRFSGRVIRQESGEAGAHRFTSDKGLAWLGADRRGVGTVIRDERHQGVQILAGPGLAKFDENPCPLGSQVRLRLAQAGEVPSTSAKPSSFQPVIPPIISFTGRPRRARRAAARSAPLQCGPPQYTTKSVSRG